MNLLQLSPRDQDMLSGQEGPATQLAMSIIVRMAEFHQASNLLDISQAHIDSSIYTGLAGLEFAERLSNLGAKVSVPSTLNVSGVDEFHWQEWNVPPDWATKAHRQMVAYQNMGCRPTWTCAPYQVDLIPKLGQQVAWGESNAIAFANSVLGARTERYPDYLDICAAITGRVPARGLHLKENRAGQILISLDNIPLDLQSDNAFYPVIGYFIGEVARDRIPVISGLSVQPTEDQLKALGAASASSGSVALFHIIGVTPEAQTLTDAFQGREPEEVIPANQATLAKVRRRLTTAEGSELDMVVLGSPHFSIQEFQDLAALVTGRSKHPNVRFLVTSSRAMTMIADQAGLIDIIRNFGAEITVDTCILASPMLPPNIRQLMTNSAKYAHYAPGLLDVSITYGSLQDCVES
ncbi:MAG: aconitase X catalytic domain-containing protein, partial [Candidatus Promineifilaceae bacterium]|nr:aconitase X catalytic domain-containing protein [Candidatus Promineifilaceae bacterium]